MKKTVSVNIKGINFLIEEDAYEKLQNYLERLEASLQHQEGAEDIIEDIELRIAELCDTKLSDNKDVVELSDINEILATLGNPEDYVDEDEEEHSYKQTYSTKDDKRLFRDEDEAQLAGVCAGLANYFGIDVVVVRLLWVLFFFMGFGFIMYIILWIVIPKANSSIDRLRMKGKPITVESVKDEVKNAADNFSKGSRKFANSIRTDKAPKAVSTLGRILSVGIGLFAGFLGLSFLTSFLIFILGGFKFIPVVSDQGFLSITELGELLLPSTGDVTLAWIGGLVGSISVIAFLLFLSFTLIFRIKNKWSKYVFTTLIIGAVLGVFTSIYLGMKTGRDMANRGEWESTVANYGGDTLIIEPTYRSDLDTKNLRFKNDHGFPLVTILNDRIYFSDIDIKYKNSKDSLFHIYTEVSAHGHTISDAQTRAENITYDITLDGDTLKAGTEYSVPVADKIRFQEIEVIIEIPEGKTVIIEGETIRLGETESEVEEEKEIHYQRGKLKRDGRYRHYNRW